MGRGGLGGAGPKNVVYRTPLGNTVQWSETGGGLDPYHLHTLRQWQGGYWDGLPDDAPLLTPETMGVPQKRIDEMREPLDIRPIEYAGPSGLGRSRLDEHHRFSEGRLRSWQTLPPYYQQQWFPITWSSRHPNPGNQY